ncbi:hypothetical protein [Streptomyces sp. NBC_01446]|uniref:hypothetical protein n=1 Tax=Streptomyces sp. NBC_01446 TaxID=2903870 RepID=UPI00224E79DB|nr:hypothetical protein [Streptomyces sp. NBC_01446]MCX4647052.1 hypothetical protein [Streptomyces sp. NBC_01446]
MGLFVLASAAGGILAEHARADRRPVRAGHGWIVPDADHVDLHDRKDLILLDKLDGSFTKNLT